MRYGYARVSTKEQNTQMQRDAFRKLGIEDEHIYSDKLSTRLATRENLEKLLKDMVEGDTIVVWKLDRLGRSMKDLMALTDRIKAKGCHLQSINENLSTDGTMGQLTFHILAAFAQFERDINRERTKAGLEAAKACGKKLGPKFKISRRQAIWAKRQHMAGTQTVIDLADKLKISPKTLYQHMAKIQDIEIMADKQDS